MSHLTITAPRHTVVDYTFPTLLDPTTWLSRGPGRVPPTANLARTMDRGCWASALAAVLAMGLALVLAVRAGRGHGVRQPDAVKIMLTPFAMMNAENMPTWFNTRRPRTCRHAKNMPTWFDSRRPRG